MDLRLQLEAFFLKLGEAVKANAVQSEHDLESLVRVESEEQLALWKVRGIQKTEDNKTLLEILGYACSDVEDHPSKKVIIGTIRYAPDYVIKHNRRELAVLEVKAPDVSLDNDRWTAEVVTYFRELQAPLGVLFNGRAIRVFINPEIKGLARYREALTAQHVASADEHNCRQMIDVLIQLSRESLSADPLKIAKLFATRRLAEIRGRERQEEIQRRLRSILTTPPNEFFAAVASIDGMWDGLRSRPSVAEITAAWKSLHGHRELDRRTGRQSINSSLRELVSELVARNGVDPLRSIKGLRIRKFGGNGYYPIPRTDSTEPIYVAGVPAEDARRIISDLRALIETRSIG